MLLSRKQFLKKAGIAGVSLASGSALYTLFRGDLLLGAVDSGAQDVRWAMVVDLVKCSARPGCTDCIRACHMAHNVPAITDVRREIKWLWKERFDRVFPEQVTAYMDVEMRGRQVLVTCNHCDNPPCVRVCPVQATWKRADGIVMMDHHRCIGCRYCMAACPYGSRSFNWSDPRPAIQADRINRDYPVRTRGVVEKCNLCAERIDIGQTPLCVNACPERAMMFGNIADHSSPVRQVVARRLVLRRKAELGTNPEIYYLI